MPASTPTPRDADQAAAAPETPAPAAPETPAPAAPDTPAAAAPDAPAAAAPDAPAPAAPDAPAPAAPDTQAAEPDNSGEPAAGASVTVTHRLADALARRGGPVRQRAAAGLRELGAVDRAVFAAVAATPTPSLDTPVRRLSDAANNSVLWLVIAAGLGALGGPAGRRAAVRGTVAIGVTSPLVNLAAKSAWSRRRPDRADAGVPEGRNVRMPGSASFPSGHAAAGFAFATAVGRDQPWLGMALRFLAAAVAYSRVHTGVHYPGDVVAGSLVGASVGQVVGGSVGRLASARRLASGRSAGVRPAGRRLAARRHPGGEPGGLRHGAVGRGEQAGL